MVVVVKVGTNKEYSAEIVFPELSGLAKAELKLDIITEDISFIASEIVSLVKFKLKVEGSLVVVKLNSGKFLEISVPKKLFVLYNDDGGFVVVELSV